ncbi:Response regulator protein VraR [Lacunisphaera limnophila]|uniref:Response regulator protein VraR n=1 Tax=Lacunisphaera limnophila TaxID=1838286 RepID=A0A1D8ARW1_9BACT|nr:response regulator transcription factor [Lacunisphaera limnophila]AOS43610.1 Response regulator protein VraR [Lacunisphaera limnophila]
MILCIDDDTLLLDFLVAQVELIMPAGTTILRATTGAEGLDCALKFRPDLAIIDLGLPDMSGFTVAMELAATTEACRILMVSGNLTETAASRMLHSRVQGCLLKSSARGIELVHALRELAAGRAYFSGEVLAAVAAARQEPGHFSKILSDRETELMPYFGFGWSHDRIAQYTRITPATVRTHHQHILEKLGLHSREELMRWAMKKGFVDFRYEPAEPWSNGVHEGGDRWPEWAKRGT